MATAVSSAYRYFDPKVLARIARMDLRARLVVEGYISGLHKSPYHGYSVEFAAHREYVPGDELKHLDWKVWARADRFYIKQYEEETNLRCTLVLDCSRSMRYGGDGKDGWSKFDHAATAAASLAHFLNRQQDAVGLVAFDTAVRLTLPASSHPSQVKQIYHELEQLRPDQQTDAGGVFHQLAEATLKRGLVVILSDCFVDTGTLQAALQHFRHRRQEVVLLHVLHADELTFPFQDNTLFRGLEAGGEVLAEPRALRKAYLDNFNQFLARVRQACATAGVDYVLCNTAEPLDAVLSAYLAFRQRTARKARHR